MNQQTGPVFAANAYAGFWRRTLALLLDAFILTALWTGVTVGLTGNASIEEVVANGDQWMIGVGLFGGLLYLVAMRLTDGGTLGYRIVGIRYAYMLSGDPDLLTRIYRAILAIVLLWFFSLDHIWILFDERKQAWHDKVSGFYVVKRNAKPLGTTRVGKRMTQFMGLSLPIYEPLDMPAAGG